MTDRPHGTLGRYSFGAAGRTTGNGCRCEPCRAASRRSYKRRALNGPAYIDGTEAANHVRRCIAVGMNNHQIGMLADLGKGGQTIISHLLSRPDRKLRPATAAALLAVPINPCAAIEGASCDATGTRRRLRALIAIGYDAKDLAHRLGAADSSPLQIAKRARCDGATAIAVRVLYDQLANTPGPSDRARANARRQGWLAPLWWDDDTIDDPTAEPEGLREYDDRGRLLHDRTAWRIDEVDRLTRAGYTTPRIAEQLNVPVRQVRRDRELLRRTERMEATG